MPSLHILGMTPKGADDASCWRPCGSLTLAKQSSSPTVATMDGIPLLYSSANRYKLWSFAFEPNMTSHNSMILTEFVYSYNFLSRHVAHLFLQVENETPAQSLGVEIRVGGRDAAA
jgi:hypothetical protein